MANSSYASDILESVASTNLGQFFIKKIDLLLWTVEKPAKYCVDGESKSDRNLPWPIFWIVLINLQIFRIVFSMISVQLNKGPVESKDIVKNLQKWRRWLRSIRFRGLRNIRESQYGKEKANENGREEPALKQCSKKRNHDEMLEDELLGELMNQTYSDTDQTDSTFMASKCSQISTNGSSNDGQSVSEDDFHSPVKSKNGVDSSLQDTLPVSANESEHHEPNESCQSNGSSKTNEMTFVSTVDDTEEDAADESTGKDHSKAESNGTLNGSSKTAVSKESLNEPTKDPVDVMMSKLVEMESNGKIQTKRGGKNKKKRNFSLTTSQENVNRQDALKESKSQETINHL